MTHNNSIGSVLVNASIPFAVSWNSVIPSDLNIRMTPSAIKKSNVPVSSSDKLVLLLSTNVVLFGKALASWLKISLVISLYCLKLMLTTFTPTVGFCVVRDTSVSAEGVTFKEVSNDG